MIEIAVGDKEYLVEEAKTEEEREKGLMGIENLPKDVGMLFYHNKPSNIVYWMKDTPIPLDIVYIGEDKKVISVNKGKPFSEDLIPGKDVMYVLEVNAKSGIHEGDILSFEDDDDNYVEIITMKVLAPDGSTQMELEGGERIFSIKDTKKLIRFAKKADASKEDKDYKALGKRLFKFLAIQDSNKPEYVDHPKD